MYRITKKFLSGVVLAGVAVIASGAEGVCDHPLQDARIATQFERLATKQLALEFGDRQPIRVNGIRYHDVGTDLIRVEATAEYRKPGQAEPSTSYITGWLSRCSGTLILRGNTWLADGTLAAPRFTTGQLLGRGIVLGEPGAAIHVLAFVDSRCSQCHRLIGYARRLVEQGKMQIELRQVAYLEKEQEAVLDTRLPETPLIVVADAPYSDGDYLEMLSEFNNEEPLDEQRDAYRRALDLIGENTRTARDVLHITTVPGVLILEADKKAYRLTSYWEMNRLFQPDL